MSKKTGPAESLKGKKAKPASKKKAGSKKAPAKKTRERGKYKYTIEPSFQPSNDPEQTKLLAKVQTFMREKGSRNSVLPNLKVVNELKRLKGVIATEEAHLEILREAASMIETSKVYKRAMKDEKPLEAKDAFKFT